VLYEHQIDDGIRGPFDESITQDIDAAPTQDTAEPPPDTPEAPVGETAPIQDTVLGGTRPQAVSSLEGTVAAVVADTQVDDAPVTFPSSDVGEAPVSKAAPLKEVNPVAFVAPDSAPVAFPGSSSDEAASQRASSTAQTPGITFAPEVGTPERRGSPDPDVEPKRKRISSQNFQRLARKITVSRRSGSVSGIPILGNLRRDNSSASASASAPAPASTDSDVVAPTSESPAPSIQSEPDKGKKKEKDKKKRRSFL